MKSIAIVSAVALLLISCGNSGSRNSGGTGTGSADIVTEPCSSECGSCASACCGAKTEAQECCTRAVEKESYVEVLYFHGKKRCATCMAIETNAKEAVESNFADQLKEGNVVFRVVDITDKENESIVSKYEVAWSSLFIVDHQGDKETSRNMTEFAFGNARRSPDVFKEEVVKTINGMLE